MTSTHEIDWTGRVLRLRVEGPAQGGEFVARHEGRVVFCRGGITGEVVDVRVDGDPGRSFCRGTVQRVVEASADRIETYCPAAAAGAGCCDWSHIRAEAARGFSGRILAEQAGRIGRITVPGESVPVEVPAGDGAVTGWRTVARWVSGPDGVPGVRRARSRELVTQPCVQADPRLLEAVRAAAVGPHREILGVLGDDGEVHLARRPLTDQAPRGRDRRSGHAAATRARARHSRAEPWETVAGPSTVVRRVGGH
ncbi:MAG TPA: class I SAM-dependent RNA methyltransferase, partial [Dietzia sp.]|nr:class I SAM-dependent RNA methyltransferase [Dietzia sp.]